MHPRNATIRPHQLQQAALSAVTLTLVLSVAACGGAGQSSAPTEDASAAAELSPAVEQSGAFNETDVAFLQGMIPHHEGAIRMAEMVPAHTDRPELRELASAIIATQTEEIGVMRTLLERAGAPTQAAPGGGPGGGPGMGPGGSPGMGPGGSPGMGPGGSPGMGPGMGPGMPMQGMMDSSEMGRLGGMQGVDFDRMWTQGMIRHHEGAITAAEQVLREGENPQVAELARQIVDAQRAEIDQMRAWLLQWGG